jgi:HK97 family phage major capsid protein
MLALGMHFDKEEGEDPEKKGAGAGGGKAENVEPATKLREEFSRLHGEAKTLIDGAIAGGRELTADEKTANENRFKRLKTIKDTLDEQLRFANLAIADAPTNGGGGVTRGREPQGRDEFDRSDPDRQQFAQREGETDAGFLQRHRKLVNDFIRTGAIPAKLQFTLTTGSGSGVLLPTSVGKPVVIKAIRNTVRAALMARGLKVIETDGMEAMSVPVFDDTANTADAIAENSTSENNKDPSVGGLDLGATLYDSGTVWASNTLLNSQTFDLLAYLEPMLDARIEAAELAAWMVLLAAATVGKTTSTTTGVTYGELLDWQHSIPLARRADGVFFVSDGLFRTLRGMVDDNDRPIYQESLRDDAPDRLLGWPLFPTTGLAAPAAGAVSGVAASAEALVVRDVKNRRIARYQNIPTHPDQFGIREFSNGDFKFVTSAVRTLKHAAS